MCGCFRVGSCEHTSRLSFPYLTALNPEYPPNTIIELLRHFINRHRACLISVTLRTDISDSIFGPTSGILNETRTIEQASLSNVRNQDCTASNSWVAGIPANRWRRFCGTVKKKTLQQSIPLY